MTSKSKSDRVSRRYSGIVAAAVFVPFIVAVFLNYVVDPFGVFQTKWFPKQIDINDRFLKLEFLNANPERFNGLMWGSSRIGNTPPAVLEQHIPGGRFYNMWYGNGTLSDHLAYLRYITATHREITQHYIEIDLDLFMGTSEWSADHISFWRHPYVEGGMKAAFYASNILTMPLRAIGKKITLNLSSESPPVRYELETTGIWVDDRADRRIATDMQGHLRDFAARTNFRSVRTLRATRADSNKAALAGIVELCNARGLRCVFFTTPHHAATLNTFLVPDFLRCLRMIAEVTPFWDFSYYNSITMSDGLYYEASHFREPVGEMVAARIFAGSAMPPGDFGIYVTLSNINRVVAERRVNFHEQDAKRLAKVSPARQRIAGSM